MTYIYINVCNNVVAVIYVNQVRKQKMYKTSIYFEVPQYRDSNMTLCTDVPLLIKVRENKF